jgi:hypothetical protein
MESEERPPSPILASSLLPTHLEYPRFGGYWPLGVANEERKSVFVQDCRACVEGSALGWVNAENRSVRQSDAPSLDVTQLRGTRSTVDQVTAGLHPICSGQRSVYNR